MCLSECLIGPHLKPNCEGHVFQYPPPCVIDISNSIKPLLCSPEVMATPVSFLSRLPSSHYYLSLTGPEWEPQCGSLGHRREQTDLETGFQSPSL